MKSWQRFKDTGRNVFAGSFELSELGLFNYEGWESDWNVLGQTNEENKAMGSYWTCCCENPKMESYPSGDPHVSVGTGKTQEEALKQLQKLLHLEWAANCWLKGHPKEKLSEFFKTKEYLDANHL